MDDKLEYESSLKFLTESELREVDDLTHAITTLGRYYDNELDREWANRKIKPAIEYLGCVLDGLTIKNPNYVRQKS